ncbi:MAG: hypothetical protein LBN27_01985 [Prevotellaceae bacterium]|jgi:hypothetical protein|nr:hypothetical protein [Prevotellaceae bacterium]
MKTAKEAAREYALETNGIDFNTENIEKAFLAGVRFTQSWINVADEMILY